MRYRPALHWTNAFIDSYFATVPLRLDSGRRYRAMLMFRYAAVRDSCVSKNDVRGIMWDELPPLRESESSFYPSKARLSASFELCRQTGISRDQERIYGCNDATPFRPLVSAHPRLLKRARELLTSVHSLLDDKTSALILADEAARVVEICSAPEVIERCNRIGLGLGAPLAEVHSGTNAVALALRYREPVILRGDQHFCRIFSDWYCVAAPIIGDEETILGCVDLSTDRNARLGEKMSLIATLATRIGELSREINRDEPVSEVVDWMFVSPRQRSILRLLIEGHVAKEIALTLGISQRTVESHLEKLRKRFSAKTTVELVVKLQSHAGIGTGIAR